MSFFEKDFYFSHPPDPWGLLSFAYSDKIKISKLSFSQSLKMPSFVNIL